jgi:hypothetical protein
LLLSSCQIPLASCPLSRTPLYVAAVRTIVSSGFCLA